MAQEQDTHVVEFWPKSKDAIEPREKPQTTACESEEKAIALERVFHGIGWSARAVKIQPGLRIFLTAK